MAKGYRNFNKLEWLVVNLAETRRFELLKGLTPYLVSSEAHSTGLCDVSELQA
jgi:hypothetical protein